MNNRGQTQYFKIFLLVMLVIFVVRVILPRMLDKSVHRGRWYSVKVPEGWEKKKGENEVIFICPDKDFYTEVPFAKFSIYGKQSRGALFLDDFFVDVLKSYARRDGVIFDKGEIKIDGQISKWVLFRSADPYLASLTFYSIDDWGRFTKIQYVAHPDKFQKYRPKFEEFKNSIKFKKFL